MSHLRFGVLRYINCLPATMAIERGEVDLCGWEVQKGIPAELNARMRAGSLDVSLVSAAEYLENEEHYQLLDEFGQWCLGPVESVCLFSPRSRRQLTDLPQCVVGVTPESATSVALTGLLLPNARTEVFASLESAEVGLNQDRFQAVLLIGDKALSPPEWTRDLQVHDLSEWWNDVTGYPMTFAVWVARKDLPPSEVNRARSLLKASLAWGSEHNDDVVAEGARRSGLSEARIRSYLENLNFLTTEESRPGFLEFRTRLRQRRIFGVPPVTTGLCL